MVIALGAEGVRIHADCVNDISAASVTRIKYKKPDGTTGFWTASKGSTNVTVDGEILEANTYIYFDTVTDSVDAIGTWLVQAYIEMGTLKTHGNDDIGLYAWSELEVKEHL